jgi:hypothetical protein
MWLPWQPAVLAATALVAIVVATRGWPSTRVAIARAFAGEIALVLALYSLWQIAGQLSVMRVDGAMARGSSLWNIEQALHLPSELRLQQFLLDHPVLIQFCNGYYAIAHVPAVIAVLIWAFVWHRDRYPRLRNVLALLTGACLLIQLVPVAPPRLLPGLGFVDAGHLYGQSVYTAVGTGVSDQLSAMPSLHVGWAVLVALAVVLIGTSPWRWLVLLHPALTLVVVAGTGNHWWLDGVAAIAVLGVVALLEQSVQLALPGRSVPQLAGALASGSEAPSARPTGGPTAWAPDVEPVAVSSGP